MRQRPKRIRLTAKEIEAVIGCDQDVDPAHFEAVDDYDQADFESGISKLKRMLERLETPHGS